jgi:hypothetical protein
MEVIAEVADSMPQASAREVVDAIIARLNRGLPKLVEVDTHTVSAEKAVQR